MSTRSSKPAIPGDAVPQARHKASVVDNVWMMGYNAAGSRNLLEVGPMPKIRVKRHAVNQPHDTSYRLIPLTRNQNATVDASDYEWLSQWNWHAVPNNSNSFYAVRTVHKPDGKCDHVQMAREVLGCSSTEEADHIDHVTLDNRRSNLRKATREQNMWNRPINKTNRSGFKGVHWYKRDGNWHSTIKVRGKQLYLGTFDSPEKAHAAYTAAVAKIHGEFACPQ